MTISFDREENEIRTLFEFSGELTGQRVLEIGCGDGRLTWRYASQAAQVVAIDPDPEKIDQARQKLPEGLSDRVSFHAFGLEEFISQRPPHDQTNKFDLVLLSWSL
jgi:2-polyprenyl-3-methyl-5-hydroxy-6-metoxy-1,4-benzoquinol methylase